MEAVRPLSWTTAGTRRLTWAAVATAAVMVVAAWLRLRHLDNVQYSDDQAIALRMGHDILKGNFRTVGLASSAGAPNPPLYVYLVAAALAIRDGLLFPTVTVAIASVAAILASYFVVRPRFGTAVAWTTAAFFATAPWAVLYGRYLWQQDYLPLVVVGLLWSLFVVLEVDRTRVAGFVPVLFIVAFQLNMSAITLIVPVVALLVYRFRRIDWRAFGVGTAVGLVSLGTWFAHMAKHPGDLGLIFANGRGHHGGTTGGGAIEAARQAANLASAEGWTFETGQQHPDGLAWTLGRAAGIAVIALLVVGIVVSVARFVRERQDPSIDTRRRALLVVWVVGVCLVYLSSTRSGVGPHYLIVDYPVSLLLAALGLRDVAGLVRSHGKAVAFAAAMAISVAFAAFTLSFQAFVERHDGARGAYGVVYRESAALASAARARHLHVGYARAEYFVSGHLNVPDGTPSSRVIPVRDRLHDPAPLPCAGTRRWFGPLEACFPR